MTLTEEHAARFPLDVTRSVDYRAVFGTRQDTPYDARYLGSATGGGNYFIDHEGTQYNITRINGDPQRGISALIDAINASDFGPDFEIAVVVFFITDYLPILSWYDGSEYIVPISSYWPPGGKNGLFMNSLYDQTDKYLTPFSTLHGSSQAQSENTGG